MLSICHNTLNHGEIGKQSEEISKITPFLDKYDWKDTNYPSGKDDWIKLEKNKPVIALNVLYAENENIYPASISKCNSKREKKLFSY